jgi:TIR domain/NB-ARC domain
LREQTGPSSIFLSYARSDDELFVRRLFQVLRQEYRVWFDRESMPSRSLTFLQEIREAIDRADRLIIVIGPVALGSDYVRAEWQYALTAGKLVTPILRLGTYDAIPAELANLHCPDFREDADWEHQLSELHRILKEDIPEIGNADQVPAPPAHFQPRLDDLSRLAEEVFSEKRKPGVLSTRERVVVLHGMGGAGKSVLAASFARSTETRRAYHDGVVWLELGPKPDIQLQLELAASQLSKAFVGAVQGAAQSSVPFANKLFPDDRHHFVVLDDVWDAAHIEPFVRHLGRNSALLVTTRNSELASSIGGREIGLEGFSHTAALRHLSDWSGCKEENLPTETAAVAQECGNLPFGLALCGAMVRNGTTWRTLLQRLRASDLQFFRISFPNYPYPDLLRCLAVSFEDLAAADPTAAKLFGALAVFPVDEEIPEGAILRLWKHQSGIDADHARTLLSHLNNRAVLRLIQYPTSRRVKLHDLEHDYLVTTTAQPAELHQSLLNAYEQTRESESGAVPDDGYYFDHLSYHLVGACADLQMRKLISAEWMKMQFRRTGSPTAFAQDVRRIMQYARGQGAQGWPMRVRAQIVLVRMRSRLTDIPVETISALAEMGERQRAAGYAALIQETWKRSRAYGAIASAALDEGEKPEALRYIEGALTTLNENPSQTLKWDRTEILTLLARAGEVRRALTLARRLERHRDEAQSKILQFIATLGSWREQLDALKLVESPGLLASAYADMAGRMVLAGNRQDAISLLNIRKDDDSRDTLAIALVNALGAEGNRKAAVEIAQRIENPHVRNTALRELSSTLAKSGFIDDADQVAALMTDHDYARWAREDVLQALVSSGETERAYARIHCIEDETERSSAVRAIAKTLSAKGNFRRVIEICNAETSGDYNWSSTIKEVVNVMKAGEVYQFLDLILQGAETHNSFYRNDTFAALIARLANSGGATGLTKVQAVAERLPEWEWSEVPALLAIAYARSGMNEDVQLLLPTLRKRSAERLVYREPIRVRSQLCLVLGLIGQDREARELLEQLAAEIPQIKGNHLLLVDVLHNTALGALHAGKLTKWVNNVASVTGEGVASVLAEYSRKKAWLGLVDAWMNASIQDVQTVAEQWIKDGVRTNLIRELFQVCHDLKAYRPAVALARYADRSDREHLLDDLGKRNEWDFAFVLIDENIPERAELLAKLALALSAQPERKLIDRVRAMSESLPKGRALALTEVARALNKRGDALEGRQMLLDLLSESEIAPQDQNLSHWWPHCRRAMLAELSTPKHQEAVLQRVEASRDFIIKGVVLKVLLPRLLHDGLFESAIEVLQSMDDIDREHGLRLIVLALVSQGDDAWALQLIGSSKSNYEKSVLRAAMIDALFTAGESERAAAIYLQYAKTDGGYLMKRYVAGLARHNQADLALQIARSSAELDVLEELAFGLHQAGNPLATEVAQEALDRISGRRGADYKDDSTVRLHIAAGQFAEAAAAANRMRGGILKVREIVTLLDRAGGENVAIALAKSVDGQSAMFDACQALVISMVRRGAFERALRFASETGSRFDQSRLEAVIVHELVSLRASHIEHALGVASRIRESAYRAEALADCSIALVRDGQPISVGELLKEIEKIEPVYRARALVSILNQSSFAESTDLLQQIESLSRAIEVDHRAEALAAAGSAWQRLGDMTKALALVDEALDVANKSSWKAACYQALHEGAPALGALQAGMMLLNLYDEAVELDSWHR